MNDNFVSYVDYINESLSSDNGYGCIMLYADVPDWHKLIRRLVREKDLYHDPVDKNEYGYEEKPHITLLFGIHDERIIDKGLIYNRIKDISVMKINVNEVGVFSNDDSPYDVIKFNVKPSKTLLSLRKSFEEDLPNTQTFPDYHPHMTIAYVKPGEGKKYESDLDEPFEVTFTKGVYSYHEKDEDGEVEKKTKKYVFNAGDDEYKL